MPFEPPPESVCSDADGYPVNQDILDTAARPIDDGAFVLTNGTKKWLVKMSNNTWTLSTSATGAYLVTSQTGGILAIGSLNTGGSFTSGGVAYWLCAVLLADGSKHAIAIAA